MTSTESSVPLTYCSIRINAVPDEWDAICKLLFEHDATCPTYVAYPHQGKDRTNPHFHIAIPMDGNRCEVYRKRIQRHYKGNGAYSLKWQVNGMLAAIQYMSKEGTDPIYSEASAATVISWIGMAPRWENRDDQSQLHGKRKRDPDHPFQITYVNLIRVCLRERARMNIKSTDLCVVLDRIRANGIWALSVAIHKGGIPKTYLHEFVQATLPFEKRSHKTAAMVYEPGYVGH